MRWLYRLVLVILAAPAVLGLGYAAWNWASLREDPAFVAYLDHNSSAIDLSEKHPFSLAPSDLNHRLILLGEIHGIAVGQDLDFALLKQLNAEIGVRRYIGEFDPAQAARLNAYLDDGDESHLRRVFKFWFDGHAQWANKNFMEKIRRIRALNAALPDERKIRFIGGDRIQDMPLMAQHLDGLLSRLPETDWPGQAILKAVLANPEAWTQNAADAPLPLAAVEAGKTRPTIAPTGADPIIWNEISAAIAALGDRALIKGREAAITAAFERAARDPTLSAERLYGFWGQYHVLDATVEGSKPLVRRLNEGDSPLRGEILSISILNTRSEMMFPSLALPDFVRPTGRYFDLPYSLDGTVLVNTAGINDLKAASKGALTLYKMNAPGTPFPGTDRLGVVGGLLGMMQPFKVDAASVGPNAAVQYSILAVGSPATTPLSEIDLRQ